MKETKKESQAATNENGKHDDDIETYGMTLNTNIELIMREKHQIKNRKKLAKQMCDDIGKVRHIHGTTINKQ